MACNTFKGPYPWFCMFKPNNYHLAPASCWCHSFSKTCKSKTVVQLSGRWASAEIRLLSYLSVHPFCCGSQSLACATVTLPAAFLFASIVVEDEDEAKPVLHSEMNKTTFLQCYDKNEEARLSDFYFWLWPLTIRTHNINEELIVFNHYWQDSWRHIWSYTVYVAICIQSVCSFFL